MAEPSHIQSSPSPCLFAFVESKKGKIFTAIAGLVTAVALAILLALSLSSILPNVIGLQVGFAVGIAAVVIIGLVCLFKLKKHRAHDEGGKTPEHQSMQGADTKLQKVQMTESQRLEREAKQQQLREALNTVFDDLKNNFENLKNYVDRHLNDATVDLGMFKGGTGREASGIAIAFFNYSTTMSKDKYKEKIRGFDAVINQKGKEQIDRTLDNFFDECIEISMSNEFEKLKTVQFPKIPLEELFK
jgi:hypothetical protein